MNSKEPLLVSILRLMLPLYGLALYPFSVLAADAYPIKPARIVVAFPPGSATDIVGRIVAQKLSEMWKLAVIVDNRGGASGTIGTDAVAKAPADGYTMLLGTMGNFVGNPFLYANLPFDIGRDLAPVSLVVRVPFVMVVHPSVPARTVGELIKLAKARPGQLDYCSSGVGATNHLGMEMFNRMAGVKIVHVPYKGSAPAFTDLLAGRIAVTIDNLPLSLPYIKEARLRVLAVAGLKRLPVLPNVPTLNEAGVPGYNLTNWFGLMVPAGTPHAAVQRLNADVASIMKMPDVRERLSSMTIETGGSTVEEFATFFKSETAKWGKLIKEAGIKGE